MMKFKSRGMGSKFGVALLILSVMMFLLPSIAGAADQETVPGTEAKDTPGDLAAQGGESGANSAGGPAQTTAAQGSAGAGATSGLSPLGIAGIVAAAGVAAAAVAISLGGNDSGPAHSGPAHN